MNETTKKNLKRSLAGFLAVLMVAGLSYFAKDSALKADENAPETEVVREAADVPVEPAPELEPEVVVQEVIVSVPEPVAEEPVQEPVAEEPVQEPAAEEPVQEPAAEEPVQEPVSEEPVQEPVAEEPAFDVEAAYEHYMSLAEDWQKEQYLNSLSAEDRAELKQYIADKESEAAAQEAILAELAAQAEGKTEAAEELTEEAPLMLSVAAPETEAEAVEEAKTEAIDETEAAEEAAAETEEAPEELAEAPEEEPVDLSFGSAHIAGEWTGRETSSARSLTINIYVDGNLADSCVTSANQSVANFVIYAGDNEITDVTTDYWAMSGSGAAWSVDMYGANDVTVNVNMKSLLPAEEEAPAEEAEETEEAAEETELTEEPEEAEPSYAVTEEWGGRETSTDRTVHLVFMLGEEVLEARDITGRNTEVTFSVAAEGYTVLSVESDAGLTNDGNLYTVDMNSIYEATVTVTLAAPAAEEKAEEELPAEETEPEEEAEEPTEEEFTEEPEEEVEYLTDEEGNLILDEDGNPIPVEKEEAEEEAAAEAAYEITNTWGGEETENTKTLTVIISIDGEEAEVKTIEGNSTEPSFTIGTKEYTLVDITSEAAFTLEENICTVDMSETDEATVVVLLANPKAKEAEKETVFYNTDFYYENATRGGDEFFYGDTVRIVAVILDENVDSEQVTYAWVTSHDGGETIIEQDCTDPTYEFVLTEETENYLWGVDAISK